MTDEATVEQRAERLIALHALKETVSVNVPLNGYRMKQAVETFVVCQCGERWLSEYYDSRTNRPFEWMSLWASHVVGELGEAGLLRTKVQATLDAEQSDLPTREGDK